MTQVNPARERPTRFERVVLRMHRFYAAIRHRAADEAATAAATGRIESLESRRHCLVVTYRRNGLGVATPVWFGLDDRRVYFRCEASSGKAKRLRVNTAVRVAPCSARGRPLGAPFEGRARILAGDDAERAEAIIQSNYWLGRRMYERWFTLPNGMYVEVTPIS
jgi:PPOX class probable F420-dependent enzyme